MEINFIKKRKEEFDGTYNTVHLFEIIDLDKNELAEFCRVHKPGLNGGIIHILNFFDSKENAEFMNTPAPAFPDEDPLLKHLVAQYVLNLKNDYSKLTIYDQDATGIPQLIRID